MRADLIDVTARLRTELKTLMAQGLRNVAYGVTAAPPCTVVGPPEPDYEAYGSSQPTQARFTVYLVATFNEEAIERLLGYLPMVVEQLESVEDTTVDAARPSVYRDPSGIELPCYVLTVSVALS